MNMALDERPMEKASSITTFLVTLGRAILQNQRRGWMDMEGVAGFCRAHGIRLEGTCPTSSELENSLREFFRHQQEFYAPGLCVDGYEQRVGWDLVFRVRAYPYGSVQSSAPSGTSEDTTIFASTTVRDTKPESPGKWAMEK